MTAEPTPRERAALVAYAATCSYRETARRLGISQHGVHARLRCARRRLGVETTLQAVYVGRAAGWLVVPELEPAEPAA